MVFRTAKKKTQTAKVEHCHNKYAHLSKTSPYLSAAESDHYTKPPLYIPCTSWSKPDQTRSQQLHYTINMPQYPKHACYCTKPMREYFPSNSLCSNDRKYLYSWMKLVVIEGMCWNLLRHRAEMVTSRMTYLLFCFD